METWFITVEDEDGFFKFVLYDQRGSYTYSESSATFFTSRESSENVASKLSEARDGLFICRDITEFEGFFKLINQ